MSELVTLATVNCVYSSTVEKNKYLIFQIKHFLHFEINHGSLIIN